MQISRPALALFLLAFHASGLLANPVAPPSIWPPKEQPPASRPPNRLIIQPSENQVTRLILPRAFVAQYVAAARPESAPPTSLYLPSILAGVALTVALVLAGLLLARRASPRLVTAGIACVVAMLLVVNVNCSGTRDTLDEDHRGHVDNSYRSPHWLTVDRDGTLEGEVLLEEGDQLKLIANRNALGDLGKKQAVER
jgi:hypothetical protein